MKEKTGISALWNPRRVPDGAFCLAVGGCSGSSAPKQEPQAAAIITGTIRESIENTLIYHAKITATGGGKSYTAFTDVQGVYALNLPAGSYEPAVEMDSFNDATASVTVGAGESKTQDFTLVTGSGGTLPLPGDGEW